MIIYTNNTKKSAWDKILKEAKPYLDKLGLYPEVIEVSWEKIPTVIKNGKEEVDLNFLKSMKPNDGLFMFHEPDFDQEGIHGRYWHYTGIAYFERKLFTRNSKYKEFKYDVARTLVHEALHYYAIEVKGMEDETHYYQEQDNLMGFVDKLVEPQDPLRELYLKLIPLLKKLIGNLKEEICYSNVPSIKDWALAIKEYEGWFPPSSEYPKGSRSYRNNNPGNLRWSKYETDNIDNFSVFPDYETGLKALEFQLEIASNGKSNVYNPNMTLLDFCKLYAPSSDNNNPREYAEFLAKKLKVDINFKIENFKRSESN